MRVTQKLQIMRVTKKNMQIMRVTQKSQILLDFPLGAGGRQREMYWGVGEPLWCHADITFHEHQK